VALYGILVLEMRPFAIVRPGATFPSILSPGDLLSLGNLHAADTTATLTGVLSLFTQRRCETGGLLSTQASFRRPSTPDGAPLCSERVRHLDPDGGKVLPKSVLQTSYSRIRRPADLMACSYMEEMILWSQHPGVIRSQAAAYGRVLSSSDGKVPTGVIRLWKYNMARCSPVSPPALDLGTWPMFSPASPWPCPVIPFTLLP
jgi:hypothetical protein